MGAQFDLPEPNPNPGQFGNRGPGGRGRAGRGRAARNNDASTPATAPTTQNNAN